MTPGTIVRLIETGRLGTVLYSLSQGRYLVKLLGVESYINAHITFFLPTKLSIDINTQVQ